MVFARQQSGRAPNFQRHRGLRNGRCASAGPFPTGEKPDQNLQNFRKLMGDTTLRACECYSFRKRGYT
jgi:hypothetical protein